MLVFSGEAKSGPAGDEDADVGSSTEQIGHERGGVEDVLVIVQNEQQMSLAYECLKAGDERFMTSFAHADGLRDGGRDEVGVRNRRQTDEAGAIQEILGQPVGDGEGQSGLAHATRSGQRTCSTSSATSRSRPTNSVSERGSGDGWGARTELITVVPIAAKLLMPRHYGRWRARPTIGNIVLRGAARHSQADALCYGWCIVSALRSSSTI
jgi:hypothetical protein